MTAEEMREYVRAEYEQRPPKPLTEEQITKLRALFRVDRATSARK